MDTLNTQHAVENASRNKRHIFFYAVDETVPQAHEPDLETQKSLLKLKALYPTLSVQNIQWVAGQIMQHQRNELVAINDIARNHPRITDMQA